MNKLGDLMRGVACTAATLGVCVLSTTEALAQSGGYPVRPVRVIVALAAGSGADVVARIVVGRLSETYGAQFVVENRGGAGGNIGVELAARAPADGYNLLVLAAGQTVNPALYPKLTYDLEKDFDPIGLMAMAPLVLSVHPSLPVKSVKELISFAKAAPGKVNYGSSGSGSSPHLAAAMFATRAGINLSHVPYKGSPQAVTDLIAGQVELAFMAPSTVMQYVKAGRLKALAICAAQRSPAAPGVPSMAESGLPGFEASTWTGMLAPAGAPKEILARLNRDIAAIVRLPEVRERLAEQGFEAMGLSAAEFGTFMRAEIAKWGKVVKATGARVE